MVKDIKYYKDLAEKTRRALDAKNKELYEANKYKALYETLQAELTRLRAVGEAVEKIDLRFVHQAKALIANTFGTAIDQYQFLEKLQKQIAVAQQALKGGEGGK